jgi:hypothetical protein
MIETNLQTVILPDAATVFEPEERQMFSELIELKNQIDELTKRYDARQVFAKEFVERARTEELVDKTFVLSGTLITFNTRKNYIFSQNTQNAEDLVKRLKADEINNGTATEQDATTFLSINGRANLVYDSTNENWISIYQAKAKGA